MARLIATPLSIKPSAMIAPRLPTALRKRALVVRASEKPSETPAAETPAATPAAASTPMPPTPPTPSTPTLSEAMAFSGAPELINGRLAQLGFLAAVTAELVTQESVTKQFGEAAVPIILTVVLISAASLIPILKGAKREAFGPLTPEAEVLNSRAAMIGFAALLGIEFVRGSALF